MDRGPLGCMNVSSGALKNKRVIRIIFTVSVLVLLVSAGLGAVEELDQPTASDFENQYERSPADRSQIVDPPKNVTVVTTSPRKGTSGSIVAFDSEGKVLYYDDTHRKYFDVDAAPAGDMSIEYVAGTELGQKGCPASGVDPCARIVIERVNLTTGDVTRLHETYAPGANIWHDVERIDEDRFLVADITSDSVYMLNTSNDIVEWRWDAVSDFSMEDGGQVSDWTHLNDVERLDDGRVMVSLRNLDQVVFVDPDHGPVEEWTLGKDDNHSRLYEQHNPDYVPRERGGPAVIVSDSENDRIIEYQRENGTWRQTWVWSDERMHWPRDADRLPSGNTLVTDSNGNRILEVNSSGDIVWSVSIDTPYEAERLGVGDESENGRSAAALNLTSSGGSGITSDGTGTQTKRGFTFDTFVNWFKQLLPSIVVNGLLFVMPKWVNAQVFVSALAILVVGVSWGVFELRWSAFTLSVTLREQP
jgi:hypothetical protein